MKVGKMRPIKVLWKAAKFERSPFRPPKVFIIIKSYMSTYSVCEKIVHCVFLFCILATTVLLITCNVVAKKRA